MDARPTLLAALLAAAASVSPLLAHADPVPHRQGDDPPGAGSAADRRERCARMRAFPAWCREGAARDAEERERVRPVPAPPVRDGDRRR